MSMGIIETLQAEIQSLKERVTALEQIEKKRMYDEAYNDYLNGDLDEIIESSVKEARQLTRDDGIFRTTPERKAAARERIQAPRQLTRDDIIEMAKRDVAELLAQPNRFTDVPMSVYVKFVVNREKRTVVALIYDLALNFVKKRGIAKCHPDDCFNAAIGRAIALRRALGLEVPDEYLNAPQPTEVRVGDIVETYLDSGKPFKTFKVVRISKEDGITKLYDANSTGFVRYEPEIGDRIIDDSRVDAEQEV
jgi:hypothetical protein